MLIGSCRLSLSSCLLRRHELWTDLWPLVDPTRRHHRHRWWMRRLRRSLRSNHPARDVASPDVVKSARNGVVPPNSVRCASGSANRFIARRASTTVTLATLRRPQKRAGEYDRSSSPTRANDRFYLIPVPTWNVVGVHVTVPIVIFSTLEFLIYKTKWVPNW